MYAAVYHVLETFLSLRNDKQKCGIGRIAHSRLVSCVYKSPTPRTSKTAVFVTHRVHAYMQVARGFAQVFD